MQVMIDVKTDLLKQTMDYSQMECLRAMVRFSVLRRLEKTNLWVS